MTNRAYNTAHLYELDGMAAASTPFSNAFRQDAKAAGAKWNASARAWTLPLAEANTLRELLAANFPSFNDEFAVEEEAAHDETPKAEAPVKRELTDDDRALYEEASQAVEELKGYRTLPTKLSDEGKARAALADRLRVVADEMSDAELARRFRVAACEVVGREHHDMAWSSNDVRSLEGLEAPAAKAPTPTAPLRRCFSDYKPNVSKDAEVKDEETVVSHSHVGEHGLLVVAGDYESLVGPFGKGQTYQRLVRRGPGYAHSVFEEPGEESDDRELVFGCDGGWAVERGNEGYAVLRYGRCQSSPFADPFPTTPTLREAVEWLRRNGHVSAHEALMSAA